MIKVERIDLDFVLFLDVEKETSFHSDAKEKTFKRLVHDKNIGLNEEQCQQLYKAILKFDIVYIDKGKLFKKKKMKKTPNEPIVPKIDNEDDRMDKLLRDSLERIDDLAGMEKKANIVGIRHDR